MAIENGCIEPGKRVNLASVTPLPTAAWWVYIIEASDGKLYTGICTSIVRRWREHLSGPKGARFFRGRRPQCLVYMEPATDRSKASIREAAIKKLSCAEKWNLVARFRGPCPLLRAPARSS